MVRQLDATIDIPHGVDAGSLSLPVCVDPDKAFVVRLDAGVLQ